MAPSAQDDLGRHVSLSCFRAVDRNTAGEVCMYFGGIPTTVASDRVQVTWHMSGRRTDASAIHVA